MTAVNDALGTVTTWLYTSGNPLEARAGSLLEVTFHVRSDATPGSRSALDLDGELNEGQMALTPIDGSIAVAGPNSPPSVDLANTVTTLSENTSTANRLKVADINISDDGTGTNVISLSGDDADLFVLEPDSGTGSFTATLYLKAGTVLDFETNPVLDVTVEVDDPTVGAAPDDTADLTIAVTPYTVEIFIDPSTGNLEYKMSYDGFHFATVLQTPAGAISFRGHPDQSEPNGWGSTVQENVFIAGPGVDATGGEVTSAIVDAGGIQVSAGGDVASAGGSAGTWTWTSTITYDPSQETVMATGTTTVTLAAALGGHMNVGRTSSNYLYDYPLNGGGFGPTGDMKSMTFAYGPDAAVGEIQWTPLPGLEGTSPQDASDDLAITVWGQINRSDPLQTAVAKPAAERRIVSSDSTTRLIVAAYWDSTQVGYQFDNVGVAPVVLPQNTQATSFVFQTTESWTLPDTSNPTVTAESLTTTSGTPTLTGTVNPSSPGKPLSQVMVVLVGSQTRLTLPATIDGTNWSLAISTPLAAGTYDVRATATDTGGNTAFGTAELTIAAPEFLGTVDFADFASHDLSAGDAWYRLLASRDGWLTVEALREDVEVALFDESWSALQTSSLVSGSQRLDERVLDGETFYVRVSGASGTADLRFVNLIQHQGTPVAIQIRHGRLAPGRTGQLAVGEVMAESHLRASPRRAQDRARRCKYE